MTITDEGCSCLKDSSTERLFAFITQAVDDGVFPFGSKVPSLRKICSQFSCSLSVALQAYRELEMEGVILPIEKSGYFATCREKAVLPEPCVEDYSLKPKEIQLTSLVQTVIGSIFKGGYSSIGCSDAS